MLAFSSETEDILGVHVSRLGLENSLRFCSQRILTRAGGYICFANVHSVTEACFSGKLKAALNGALLTMADGVPLIWVSHLRRRPIESRVCGPDFMRAFLERHPAQAHGFIGGMPGQAEVLAQKYRVPAVCYSPPMREFSPKFVAEDWFEFLKRCPGGKVPAVVWVGLGAPKQELWMQEAIRLSPETLFFGVGAAYDFLTDVKRRAPMWMQKLGLEWFFRLIQEPRRLWRRYLVNNSIFLFLLIKEAVLKICKI